VSTYRATVRVEDGMLHTARPLTAPEAVADMIDSLVYAMQDPERGLLGVEVTVETSEESHTPIGDGVVGTSTTPLPASDDGDDVDEDGLPALTVPGGQA
jgi:hypothetical protein